MHAGREGERRRPAEFGAAGSSETAAPPVCAQAGAQQLAVDHQRRPLTAAGGDRERVAAADDALAAERGKSISETPTGSGMRWSSGPFVKRCTTCGNVIVSGLRPHGGEADHRAEPARARRALHRRDR